MSKKKIIRIVALLLGLVILVGAIFLIVGVSFPPEYSEIEADFKALILGVVGDGVIHGVLSVLILSPGR